MKKLNPIMQILFFPLTVWLAIGTFFLLLLSKFELGIKSIGNETKSYYFKYKFNPTEYHKLSFWATFFFFIVFPFWLIKDLVLFLSATFIYIYEYVVSSVELLYQKIIQQVQILWENISNLFK